jgi:hypothetical protein
VSGWITDFILFWWALLYWNARKTWFRLQGAHRDSCPCQVYSDSGHALDSRCNAVANWRNPARFRRVCPLLTETKDGWRCGVDAERVRPFWGRAAAYGLAGFAVLYLGATLGTYAFLRAARYDVTYATVAWPPHWSELRQSQEKLYAARAQQALAGGNYAEAILALQMVCKINPHNYGAAITLASLTQVAGQPFVAEHIFSRLMHEVPEQRPTTAQIWIRALLARADHEQIKPLATAMLTEDAGRREAWMHALLFAARQTRDEAALQAVIKQDSGLPDWCMEVARTELLLLQRRTDVALPALVRVHSRPGSPYLPYYQVITLMALGRYDQASELIDAYGNRLPVEEAAFLRLRLFASQGWTSLMGPEYDNLLSYPMTPRLAAQFCAWFIESPDAEAFGRYADRFDASGPALNSDSLPLYHANYLAAVMSGDAARADRLAAAITRSTSADAKALRAVGELLARGAGRTQLTQLLPLAPLPVEVSYAILERTPRTRQP